MPRKGKLKIGSQNKISFERKSFNTPVCTTVSHRLMTFEEIWTRVKMRAQKTAPRSSALRHHSLAVTERLAQSRAAAETAQFVTYSYFTEDMRVWENSRATQTAVLSIVQ